MPLVSGPAWNKNHMVIHNNTQKAVHVWQDQIVEWELEAATKAATDAPDIDIVQSPHQLSLSA
jgi:hypothetical protein